MSGEDVFIDPPPASGARCLNIPGAQHVRPMQLASTNEYRILSLTFRKSAMAPLYFSLDKNAIEKLI